jgi:hypothetical protein
MPGLGLERYIYGDDWIKSKRTKKKRRKRKHLQQQEQQETKPRQPRLSTLCWCCANATNEGCEWSADFKPVEGWEAIPTTIHSKEYIELPNGKTKIQDRIVESFKVIKCPKFIEDVTPNDLSLPRPKK